MNGSFTSPKKSLAPGNRPGISSKSEGIPALDRPQRSELPRPSSQDTRRDWTAATLRFANYRFPRNGSVVMVHVASWFQRLDCGRGSVRMPRAMGVFRLGGRSEPHQCKTAQEGE